MAKEYTLKDPGEGLSEVEIVEILVSEGDRIEDGDPLVSVETDKAVNEIPAPFSGTIESIEVKQGDVVKVGEVLVTYSDSDSDSEGGKESEKEEEEEKDKDKDKEKGKEKKKSDEPEKEKEKEKEKGKRQTKEKQDSEEKKEKGKADRRRPVPAAPATRKLARELEVDLHDVEPTGPHDRVTEEDVRAFAEEKPEKEGTRATEAPEVPELPDFSQWGEIERQPLRSVRRATARQMSLSWSQIPHVMHQGVADVTELEKFRRRHKDEVEKQGGKLTLTVLVLKAVVAALKQFPRFNASLDVENGEIILKHHYHLGLAVATDRGLLVPVIRDADRKGVTELAVETVQMADKAREGELKKEEMEGGTFTITNPGPIGATSFTPIIHYPQAAILGMCSTRLEPVAIGDLDDYKVEVRLQLPLCLEYDHRINDGADAAHFVKTIIDILQDPESFLLAV